MPVHILAYLVYFIGVICAFLNAIMSIRANMAGRFGGGGYDGGSPESGPPGQNLLCICLALLAAVLGTPYVFHYVGPVVERLVYEAYGWRDLAGFMYFASFALTGIVIFALSRMALWYAISAIVAFGAMRFAGLAV